MKRYLLNILISIDQLGNTILAGNPDETMSSRLGKRIRNGKATWAEVKLCQFLSFLDMGEKRHCVSSIEEDEIS